MAAEDINLADGRLFNLDHEIERATVIGTDEEYANIAAVPSTLKYPGKRIFDKDLGVLYKIAADGATAIRQENVLIEISQDGSSFQRFDTTEEIDIKYLRISHDGDATSRRVIRVLHQDEIDVYDADIAALQAHVADEDNPHSLTGSVIPWKDGEDTIENEMDSKATRPGGYTGSIVVVDDNGDIDGSQQIASIHDDRLQIWKTLKVSGSANTAVENITADASNYELGLEGDQEMFLSLYDKYHINVETDSILMKGFSDDSAIPIGKFFTLVFAKSTTGTCTISFENIPWGANFDDIVIGQGDKIMVTGYVYSRDIYLAKRVNFDNQ